VSDCSALDSSKNGKMTRFVLRKRRNDNMGNMEIKNQKLNK